MEQVLLGVVVAVVAVGIAAAIRRRDVARSVPVDAARSLPTGLHRRDFARPDAPWAVVVFTSAACDTCAGVWERVQPLASDDVAVEQVEYGADRARHERYGIESVPTTLLVDADGAVHAAFVGPVTASELWAAVAAAREPDSP